MVLCLGLYGHALCVYGTALDEAADLFPEHRDDGLGGCTSQRPVTSRCGESVGLLPHGLEIAFRAPFECLAYGFDQLALCLSFFT